MWLIVDMEMVLVVPVVGIEMVVVLVEIRMVAVARGW